jgi:hypothetical protein
MTIRLILDTGKKFDIELPFRLNKGDQIYPFDFITKEKAIECGISEEYYEEHKTDMCYVYFLNISKSLIVFFEAYLTEFE